MGYTYKKFSILYWFLNALISLSPLLILPNKIIKATDIATWFLYIFLFFPSSFIIPMVSIKSNYSATIFVLILMSMFFLFEFIRNSKQVFKLIKLPFRLRIYTIILPITTILLSLIIFSYSGFNVNFDINVYARRLASREILIGNAGYIEAFLTTICIPLLFIYSLSKKNLITLIIVIFAIIAVFSLKGSKGVLFSPLFLATIYYILSFHSNNIGYFIVTLFILFVSLSLLEGIIFNTNFISSLFIRRKLFVPSLLTTYYWEFFTENPFYLMKDSIIGPLLPFETNYSIPRPRLIGLNFFNNIETNANANIWATAYADFGYFGMIITTVIAAYIIKIFDLLGNKRNLILSTVMSTYIAFVWTEGALYTSILTNGLLFLIISIWLGNNRKDI